MEQRHENYSKRTSRNPTEHLASIGIFVRVAESRSFSLAAKRLAMSPSGVSKAIKRMEERLGARLINRTTHSISLTQEGEMYLAHCLRALEQLDAAGDAITGAGSTPAGTVRLQIAPAVGREIVVPAMSRFTGMYEGISVEVVLDGRMLDLADEGIDLAIWSAAPPDRRIVARRLSSVCYVLCAAPQYLKRFGVPTDIDALQAHRCINYLSPRSGRFRQWDLSCDGETRSLHIPGHLSFNDVSLVRDTAVAGAGIAYLPDFVADAALADGRLQVVMPQYLHHGPPFYIAYLQNRQLPHRVRLLHDFLVQLLPQTPAWHSNVLARAISG